LFTHRPIKDALILCNGEQNPYTQNSQNSYVFSDLEPGEYNINVSCPGYVTLTINSKLRQNRTEKICLEMPYVSTNPSISIFPRFEFQFNNSEFFKNKSARITLTNPIKTLLLIRPAKQGDKIISLNFNDDKNLFPQNYTYTVNEKTFKLFLVGYDIFSKTYILNNNLAEDMPENGEFNVYWKLQCDQYGKIVLPFMQQFMKGPELKFKIFCDKKNFKANANVDKFTEDKKVIPIKLR
jgi:hypothetical protein